MPTRAESADRPDSGDGHSPRRGRLGGADSRRAPVSSARALGIAGPCGDLGSDVPVAVGFSCWAVWALLCAFGRSLGYINAFGNEINTRVGVFFAIGSRSALSFVFARLSDTLCAPVRRRLGLAPTRRGRNLNLAIGAQGRIGASVAARPWPGRWCDSRVLRVRRWQVASGAASARIVWSDVGYSCREPRQSVYKACPRSAEAAANYPNLTTLRRIGPLERHFELGPASPEHDWAE